MNRELLARTFVATAKHSPLSRGRGRKAILTVLQKIHPEPLRSTFRGVPFLFHLDNTTERKALISDAYERAELDFLTGFLCRSPSDLYRHWSQFRPLYLLFGLTHGAGLASLCSGTESRNV